LVFSFSKSEFLPALFGFMTLHLLYWPLVIVILDWLKWRREKTRRKSLWAKEGRKEEVSKN
jgi:hypothetical protein